MTDTFKALLLACLLSSGALTSAAFAQDATEDPAPDNITAAYKEGGRYFTDDGVPTYNIQDDGTIDWATYSGFRRYHSECHVCHGPEGMGSSYAPALKDSALRMDYYDFIDVVTNGRQKVSAAENSVMPSFGTNPNVMCFLDDIYTYLKARGTGAMPRGRPGAKEKKPKEFTDAEKSCLGR
ncbi:MAG: c-type cytochrome, methanol metabolism-related [Rhodospirillum sp.]|nr:c-type cytochrome, methanol metabolism-related [Rhodospirillum sp.]MCF8490153.1 c-type cytochrome, methanol metabolism-related [Rhodospirillum sp.]MCF8501482.1 c-type cytochrome, methanol metabolism-related [Rhodospirillum sp.]